GRDGRLSYAPDKLGNRIPDFSHAGYMGGGVPIPNDIPVRITLAPSGGDDTDRIEKAVKAMSAFPPDARGYRGAILFDKGRFTLSKPIRAEHSGIVFRGRGCGLGGTILFDKTPVETVNHRFRPEGTITVGKAWPPWRFSLLTRALNDYIPCGATRLKVQDVSPLSEGQAVVLVFRMSQKFLDDLRLAGVWSVPDFEKPHWADIKPKWERTIVRIDRATSEIVLDYGIPCSMNVKAGHGSLTIERLENEERVDRVGIEDICFMSDYDRSRQDKHGCYNDHRHATTAVMFNAARDCWMRRCVGFFHAYALASVSRYARFITVEDCAMLDGVAGDTPKTPQGAWKYYFNASGCDTLVQRCYGRFGRHAFVFNGPTSGNVFLDCVSEKGNLGCDAHQRYQNGSMYDNVVADATFGFTGNNDVANKHGMQAVYCLMWNVFSKSWKTWFPAIWIGRAPNDIGYNWAIGCITVAGYGKGIGPGWSGYVTLGHVESEDTLVKPRSLYLAQLEERLGRQAVARIATRKQLDGYGKVWIDLMTKFSRLPVYQDPGNLDWPGMTNWVPEFDAAVGGSRPTHTAR
ncbi:MAG: hypothetical protein JXR37_01935, partial [Kiritimatiellae bacterium]|nr:hypothetical protein [Kiritimatiellia bacterium]